MGAGTCDRWMRTNPSVATMYHRSVAGYLVGYIVDVGGKWDAWYGESSSGLTRRGCDDRTSAARTCNAGLRLLGFTCDDEVPPVMDPPSAVVP